MPTLMEAAPGLVISSALFFVFSIALGKYQTRKQLNTPPVVESWIPWLGHMLAYGRQPVTYLKARRLEYGPIYKFPIAGTYMVILSTPTTVQGLLQNAQKAFDVIQFQMIGVITGVTHRRMTEIYPMIEHKAVPGMAHGLTRASFPAVGQSLGLDLYQRLKAAELSKPIPLQKFIYDLLFQSNARALLGPNFPLETVDPFAVYDDQILQIVFGIPIFAGPGFRARDKLLRQLRDYVEANWKDEDGGYLEGSSEAFSAPLRELKAIGSSTDEACRILLGFFWGAESNLIRTAFWVLAHLVSQKEVYRRVQKEVESALTDSYPNMETFLHTKPEVLEGPEYSLLNATITESMRFSSLPGVLREATKDATIQGDDGEPIIIRKGEFIIADTRGMHFDPALYENPEKFDIDRWLDKDGVFNMPSDREYSVFGTGSSHGCKGRYYALHAMRMLIILTLNLFDMEPVSINGSPTESLRFDNGSMFPVIRTLDEFWLQLRRRPVPLGHLE